MKKTILGIMILVSGMSFATSIKRIDTRLQIAITPLVDTKGVKKTTVLSVNELGQVIGAKCVETLDIQLGVGRPQYTECQFVHVVDQLTQVEMARMESLIAEAKLGEVQFPRPDQMHCLAMPLYAQRITADNGKLLLSAGAFPCGSVTYNKSEAAKELVKFLKEFDTKYSSLDAQ